MAAGANLHDELNRTDEVHQELQDQVLLLLLHLVETELSPSLLDFGGGKSDAGIGLEKILRNGTGAGTRRDVLVLRVLLSFLGLEIVDEGIDVPDILVIFFDGSNGLLALLGVGKVVLKVVGGGRPNWANVRHD